MNKVVGSENLSMISASVFILITLLMSGCTEKEVCLIQEGGFNVCVQSGTVTRISRTDSLFLTWNTDIIITANVFSGLRIQHLTLAFGKNKDNVKSLYTLSLNAASFLGASDLKSLTISKANVTFSRNPFIPFTSLRTLKFLSCGFTEIPPEMLTILPSLQELSFRDNHIRSIAPNTFIGINRLKTLDLSSNWIYYLQPDVFVGLYDLEYLNLFSNYVTLVPNVFRGLRKLTKLDITGLTKLPLKDVPTLVDLSLGFNDFWTLPPNLFEEVPQLRILRMYKSTIRFISPNVFSKMRQLKELSFVSNNIGEIEPSAFAGMNLTHLTFTFNNLGRIIEEDIFRELTVGRLYMQMNDIYDVQPGAFNGTTAEEVNLSYNALNKIEVGDFAGLDTQKLDLSKNKIEAISPGAFRNTRVKLVNLHKNAINANGKIFWGLPNSAEIII